MRRRGPGRRATEPSLKYAAVRAYYAPMSATLDHAREAGRDPQDGVEAVPGVRGQGELCGWETTTKIMFAEELHDFVALVRYGEEVRLADGERGALAIKVAQDVYPSTRVPRTTLSWP